MSKGNYNIDLCSAYSSYYSAQERHMEAYSLADALGKQNSNKGETF